MLVVSMTINCCNMQSVWLQTAVICSQYDNQLPLRKFYHERCNKQTVSLHRDCVLVLIGGISKEIFSLAKLQVGQKKIHSNSNRDLEGFSPQWSISPYLLEAIHQSHMFRSKFSDQKFPSTHGALIINNWTKIWNFILTYILGIR